MSKNIITSEVVVAYSQCPRKAYLLLYGEDFGDPHDYVHIIEEQKCANKVQYLDNFKRENPNIANYDGTQLKNSKFFIEVLLKSDNLEAYCDVLTNVGDKQCSYEPTIIVGTYQFSQEQKLELLFISTVLGKIQGETPVAGKIIGMEGRRLNVKLENSYKILTPYLNTLKEWMVKSAVEDPPVILNKHCQICQFQSFCKEKAKKEDNLSLLDRMSSKSINRYNKKGIFTLHQLSYLFKPRRKRKRKTKVSVQHNLELQALAIREKKIYLQELPELSRSPVEIFLDIEGLPDRCFYYLMGLLISDEVGSSYYFFWADTINDEEKIWRQLLEKLNEYPQVTIYHYGSYENKAINELSKRYSTDCDLIRKRLLNVNIYIYGKIYFPTFSNSLKAIGNFLGASWTSPDASGLQSIIWRHYWECTQNLKYKQQLVAYNQEDCQALNLLIHELSQIEEIAESCSNIDFADQPKKYSTESSKEVHRVFDIITKSAHYDYDRNKISFKEIDPKENIEKDKNLSERKVIKRHQKKIPKPQKLIELQPILTCPKHLNTLQESNKLGSKRVIDLVFTRNGVRKSIIKYWGRKGYCPSCEQYYSHPNISKFHRRQIYGDGFKVWSVYQRIALRLPYKTIAKNIEDLFNEVINHSTIVSFIKELSDSYVETEDIIIKKLLESNFINVDETSITIQGSEWYVWVFTNGKYVFFRLTESRETTIVHDLLSKYSGILISDFYSGYDSINCRQQKCWVHLIRDLNDDLWKNPFDFEFETFVLEIKNLIVPIMETIDKFGLKKRNLKRFQKGVENFYQRIITNKSYISELVNRYQKRFIRYRESLFTFLEYDEIPWHNNMAENAIRHLAKQREISGSFFESPTCNYLLILGVMQTCKFQEKSFLKFLLSGEKDVDKFKSPKYFKKTKPVSLPKTNNQDLTSI